jgi:hypothetical protein
VRADYRSRGGAPLGRCENIREHPVGVALPAQVAAPGEPAPEPALGVARRQDPDDVVGALPAADQRRQTGQAGRGHLAARGQDFDAALTYSDDQDEFEFDSEELIRLARAEIDANGGEM